MAIRVEHPSGAVVEFPEGTDKSTIQKAMRHFDGASGADQQSQSLPNAAPTLGETATDVTKSLGTGLARGAIGIGGLAGNIETLGRAGINKVATMAGYQPPVSPESAFPTSNTLQGAVEEIAGSKFYEPQTKAGEYARTIGEFAPAAAFPGSAIQRTLNVVAPAVTSETAGQMTKGTSYEPVARFAGAVAGGSLPALAARAVSPIPAAADHAAAVRTLEGEGVTALTAGQRTNSKPLKWAESATQDIPFAGRRASQMQDTQAEQFTRAALRRAGVDAPRATPDVIDAAFTQLGQHFDNIAQNANVVADRQFVDDLTNVLGNYEGIVPPTLQSPAVRNVVGDIMRTIQAPGAGGIAGDAVSATRSRISRMASQHHQDPQLGEALRGIREAFDDAVARTNPQIAHDWQALRQQYANLLRISEAAGGAGENAAKGLISPAQLRNAAKNANKRAYVRGQSDLGNLARAGEAVMKPLPQSGTAPRQAAMNALNVISAIGGNAAAGPAGAVAAVGAPAMLGRSVMSRPVQNYLANQLAAPIGNALAEGQLAPWQYAPQAAMYMNDPAFILSGEQDVGPDTPKQRR